MLSLDSAPKIITFDCYGTLVQWYEVLGHEIAATLAGQGGTDIRASAILDTFSIESRRLMQERPHRLYSEILRAGFATAFEAHGLSVDAGDIERIASSPMTMGPHPEVPDALRRLRKRYRLAIFTNSDDALIAPTVENIGVPFDYVITAQQAQAYKPSRDLFEFGYRRMGVAPEEDGACRHGYGLGHEGLSRTRPSRHLGESARRGRQSGLAALCRGAGPQWRGGIAAAAELTLIARGHRALSIAAKRLR